MEGEKGMEGVWARMDWGKRDQRERGRGGTTVLLGNGEDRLAKGQHESFEEEWDVWMLRREYENTKIDAQST